MGGGCRNAKIVVIETEARNGVDAMGYRWPDSVVLEGEAREMRDWSRGYGLVDGEKRTREERKEKDLEWEMGLEKI